MTADPAYVETAANTRRLEDGRSCPSRACELSAALVGVLTGRLVNDSTHWGAVWLLLAVMGVMSLLLLLIWARRQGWW